MVLAWLTLKSVYMGLMKDVEVVHIVITACSAFMRDEIDSLVQDCSITIAGALEILHPCTKASMYFHYYMQI